MGKQNMTLEDILKEYSPEPAEKQKKTAEPVKKEIKTERTASPDISDITEAVEKQCRKPLHRSRQRIFPILPKPYRNGSIRMLSHRRQLTAIPESRIMPAAVPR